MSTKKTKELVGAYDRTGVYISKSDMDQLIEVIAKAKAKDNLVRKVGIKVTGETGIGTPATLGSLSIQDFIRKLVMTYGFEDSDRKLYGVNRHGEIVRWLTPGEAAKGMH